MGICVCSSSMLSFTKDEFTYFRGAELEYIDWIHESFTDGSVRSGLLAAVGLGFYGGLGFCLVFERASGPVDFWPLVQSGSDSYSSKQNSWEYVGGSTVSRQRARCDGSSGEHH